MTTRARICQRRYAKTGPEELTKRKRLHIERMAKDRYGRTVGKVIVDGEDMGKRPQSRGAQQASEVEGEEAMGG